MKERLIELIKSSSQYVCEDAYLVERIAGHLLANGVIVLPCAVGDTVYQIVYCRCGNPQCYEQGHCWKTITKATPKSYGHIMKLQMGKRLVPDPFYGLKTAYVPKGTICHKIYQKSFDLKMLAEVGKTVFVTLEEAEKALENKQ